MSVNLDQCVVCLGPSWFCACFHAVPETFLFPWPIPVAFQQPDLGLAPVATYDWSPAAVSDWTRTGTAAAAETLAYPLVHYKHAQEKRGSTHAPAWASEGVTAAGAVTKTATKKRGKSVLDRGQPAEGSRKPKNQWTKAPLKDHMPRDRVLLALLHGESAHAPTVPRNVLVEMILGTLKQFLQITDIDKFTVRNTMKHAEETALMKDLQYTQDHFI